MWLQYILVTNASSWISDEPTTIPMLVNKGTGIFPLTSTIIFEKVLSLCYMVQLEKSPVIYWDGYVALQLDIDK